MDGNPWEVDSIHAFSCFKCPECAFFGQEEYSFQNHALEYHPLSFVLFGKYEDNSYTNIIENHHTDIDEYYDEGQTCSDSLQTSTINVPEGIKSTTFQIFFLQRYWKIKFPHLL